MNKKQKVALWIGIIVIVLMGLNPPWVIKTGRTKMPKIWEDKYKVRQCYGPIGTAPDSTSPDFVSGRICITILCVQWAMVGIVTGGLIITLKSRKAKDD